MFNFNIIYVIIICLPCIIISCVKKQARKVSSTNKGKSTKNVSTTSGLFLFNQTTEKTIINRFIYVLSVGIKFVDCVGCSKNIPKKMIALPVSLDNSLHSNNIKLKRENKKLHINCYLTNEEINNLLNEFKAAKGKKLDTIDILPVKPILGNIYVYRTDDDVTGVQDKKIISTKEINGNNSIEDTLLANVIKNGPKPFEYSFEDLSTILTKATDIVSKEPTLIECGIPCVFYGDIHGQYSDLFRWFQINGWPSKCKSVFLGDYVDRGIYGVEVIALLCLLKIEFPDNIYLIRGNHEEEKLNKSYDFYHEVLLKFGNKEGEKMYRLFNTFFTYLPLAGLVGKRILCMHGGISPKLTSLDAIRTIKRPIQCFFNDTLECDLVWSDPVTYKKGPDYAPNYRRDAYNGVGQLFSNNAVENICNSLNIDMIIRAHQVPLKGINVHAEGKIITVFSAAGYQGDNAFNINWGASLSLDKQGIITINKIRVTRKCRMNRIKVITARNEYKKHVLMR
uniref:Serine/threonine-protein phosphatase n=1 Tax=Parastrongyloides trichosuri TaxID=131310 RepID=A0A0N4ZQJ0_PARTI